MSVGRIAYREDAEKTRLLLENQKRALELEAIRTIREAKEAARRKREHGRPHKEEDSK